MVTGDGGRGKHGKRVVEEGGSSVSAGMAGSKRPQNWCQLGVLDNWGKKGGVVFLTEVSRGILNLFFFTI